jgi:hypothetical protein
MGIFWQGGCKGKILLGATQLATGSLHGAWSMEQGVK